MEPLSLTRDGFAWTLAADPSQLSLTAAGATERFSVKILAQDVQSATSNKLRAVDECYRLIKSALLARAGTLFIQPSVSRQGTALVFHVKGSMVPSGQCDFTLFSDFVAGGQQPAVALPAVALPGSKPIVQPQMPQQMAYPQAQVEPDPRQQQTQEPMSLLSGMGVSRKPQPMPVQTVNTSTTAQATAARTGSPVRGRAEPVQPTASPAVRMSTPAGPVSSSLVADGKVKRRTVMTLYRQLRDQLDENSERLPKFHGDMPSTLNMIASGIRSGRKSLNIAGRPFRGRTSNELLTLARQLEYKPLTSGSLRPLPSKIHLLVDLKNISITMPPGTDEVELQWNVFTASGSEIPLYDPIRMTLGSDGRPIPGSRGTKLIFSHLPVATTEAVVVCKVNRIGWLETAPSDAVSKRDSFLKERVASVRRPVGTAVLEIGQLQEPLLVEGAENIQTMWIYTAHDENLSSGLHALLVRKIKQGYEDMKLLPASKGVLVGLSLLSDSQLKLHAEALIPISQTRQIPLGFKETPRNDLYVTLSEANFPSKSPSSIQVTARVTQNEQVLSTISRGPLCPIEGRSDDASIFQTVVIQDTNHPRWEETFCVKLPADVIADATQKGPLVLQISIEKVDQKKVKEFAHGQLVIADTFNGVIADSTHDVPCAGIKAQGLKKMTDRALQKEDRSGNVFVRTSLSSTHVVRNQHLARLFQWRIMSPGEILEMLTRLPSAHEELVGFIPETLDTLCTLADVVDDEQVSVAVLTALSFVVDQICDDRRSKDVRSLLLAYVDGPRCLMTKRAAARLHRAMAIFFGTYRNRAANEVANVVGSLDILHRFLARGRASNSAVPGNMVDDPRQFSNQISVGLKNLMTEQDSVYFAPQAMALVKLETLITYFRQFMPLPEVSASVVAILSAIPIQSSWHTTVQLDESATPVMIARVVNEHLRSILKLEFIERLVGKSNDGLLADDVTRAALWPALLEVSRKHLIPLTDKSTEVDEDALHYASSVFQRLISVVQKGSPWEYLRPTLLQVLPALFDLWESVQQYADSITLICDIAIVILALLYVTTAGEFTDYVVNGISEHAQQQQLLTKLCLCLSSMITRRRSGSPFPSDWTEFIALQLRSTHLTILNVKTMVSNSQTLGTCKPVMAQYLQLLFAFVNSPHVRVDGQQQLQLSSKKSTAEMAEELMTLVTPIWKGLSPSDQVDVFENILGPVLKASLIFNPASIGQRAGGLFQAMFQRCVAQTGSEKHIRTFIVRTIIQDFAVFFVPRSRGRPKEFVSGWLQKLIQEPPPDASMAEVPQTIKQRLIEDMNVLVSVVAEIESLPHDKWLDLRITRTNFLLDHLKQLGETVDYIRILQVLYELHKKAGNLPQAGYALQLNIDLLSFDEDKMVDALNDLPKQSCAERKIELMRRAVDLFSRAKLYEEALDLCGPLCEYLRRRYRMKELSEALATEANLVKGAMGTPRLQPQYWFLSFNGDKLPEWVRDKEYIYVNYNREQASDLYQRLRVDWPEARIVNVFLSKQEVLAQQQQTGLIQAIPIQPVLNIAALVAKTAYSITEASETMKNWIQSIYPSKFIATVRPEPTQEFEHSISVLNHFPSLQSLVSVDVHSVSGPKIVASPSVARTASPPPISTNVAPTAVVATQPQPAAIAIPPRALPFPQQQTNQPTMSPGSSSSSSSSSSTASLPSSIGSVGSVGSIGSVGSVGSVGSAGYSGSIGSSSSPPPQPQYPASPLMFSIGSTVESPPTTQPQQVPPQALTSMAPLGANAKLPPVSSVLGSEPRPMSPAPVLNPNGFRAVPVPDPTRSSSPSPARPPVNQPSTIIPVAKLPPTALPSHIQMKLDGNRSSTPLGSPVTSPAEPQFISPQQSQQFQTQPLQQVQSAAPGARPMLPGMAPATPLQLRTFQAQQQPPQ